MRPPTIVEFYMEDLNNVIVTKIYFLESNSRDPFIGSKTITVNKNYILHLLLNPENGQ